MVRKFLGYVVILLLSAHLVNGQSQYGRLQGTVTDAKTGEPLIGVNVVLEISGKQKGGVTNQEGKYEITAIPPGEYDLTFSYVGYGKKVLKDVGINSGRTTVKDVQLEPGQTLQIIDVTEHRNLFSRDKTQDDVVQTSDEIEKMPTKSVSEIISLNTDVNTKGGGISIQGQRSSGTVIMVDGVRVRSLQAVPTRSIQQIQTITAGIPAQYGDATGGIVNITTKGASPQLQGSIDLLTSQFLDPYGFNQFEGNISGPILKKYKGTDSSETKLGFMFGGDVTYEKDPRPTVIDHPVVKDDVLEGIKEEPLVRDPTSAGFESAASFVTDEDMKRVAVRPNVQTFDVNLTGKLTYNLSDGINLMAGGQYGRSTGSNYSRTSSLFNYENYSEYINTAYRGYLRFTQSFANDDKNQGGGLDISNVFYSIQFDYARDHQIDQDPRFEDNFFKYGYYGKYNIYRTPSYSYTEDSVNGAYEEAYFMNGFQDTAVTFEQADINTTAGNYTKQYFNFQNGNVQNTEDLVGGGGLLNGGAPQLVYSLWNDVGTPVSTYNEVDQHTYSVNASGSFDIGDHSIELGVQYEQLIRSNYGINARGLWTVMRQSANSHISQLNTDNPMPVYGEDGTFLDTVNYERLNEGGQTVFDERLRSYLQRNNYTNVYGEPIGPKTFINVDRYDPSIYSMGMFSADELLNQGLVAYSGYDHKGNKISGDPSIEEFLNNPLERPMGAYNPNYTAAYISDKFQIKDLFFRLGLRVDRFDANQPVLKDRYSLYPTRKVGEVDGDLNPDGQHPGNMGSDYVVYVDDPVNPSPSGIVGYRNGDTWYNEDGTEVQDPNSLAFASNIGTISPYLTFDNEEDIRLVPEGFKDYEPQITVMPRVAFSFPISQEARFRASYDVLTQRPKSNVQTTLADYYYLEQRATQRINNPNLKPVRSNKYTLGFKQKLSRRSALELKAFYTETRNMIQIEQINQAYPTTYTTFSNIDFSTTKGITAQYDLRSTARNPSQFRLSYTLQFADGTGSGPVSQSSLVQAGQPNLRTPFPLSNDIRHNVQGIFDYRFGKGANYTGPTTGNGTQLLKNMGFNVIVSAQSGAPYSQQGNVTQAVAVGIRQSSTLEGTINGARMPWTYKVDLRIDKNIPLNWGKKGEKGMGSQSGSSNYLNLYVRIQNLFDTKNVIDVYRYTGDPDDDGFLSSAQGQQVISESVSQQAFVDQYSAKVNNPFNYQPPRLVRLGATLVF